MQKFLPPKYDQDIIKELVLYDILVLSNLDQAFTDQRREAKLIYLNPEKLLAAGRQTCIRVIFMIIKLSNKLKQQ